MEVLQVAEVLVGVGNKVALAGTNPQVLRKVFLPLNLANTLGDGDLLFH